jgi:hypothetical protein
MDYPNFDNYWLGLNESWQDGVNATYPSDPYEYKRNGSEGNWTYYTRLKDSGAGWDPVTNQAALDSIEQMVTFTGGDATDTTGTVPDNTATTTADDQIEAGDPVSAGTTTPTDPSLIPLTGANAVAKITAIQRPDWKIKLLSTLPYAKVDGFDNSYFDATGKIMYNEFNDPSSQYFGEPFLDRFTFPKSGYPDTGSGDYTDEDFDPANKPEYILNNPLYVPSATVTPEDAAKAQEAAKEEATLPGATSKQAKIAQLRKEIQDARKKNRSARRDARKEARLDRKINRLEGRKEELTAATSESRVYSFNEFVRSRGAR